MVEKIDTEGFRNILNENEKPMVVVCFLPAGCCPPSDEMMKLVGEISKEREDYDFYAINGEDELRYRLEYLIELHPTTIIFFRGRSRVAIKGLVSKEKLQQHMDEVLERIKKCADEVNQLLPRELALR